MWYLTPHRVMATVAGMKPHVALLTTSEVADLFRVNDSTVRRWVSEERLRAIMLPGGGRLRFHRADVLAILAGDAAELSAP